MPPVSDQNHQPCDRTATRRALEELEARAIEPTPSNVYVWACHLTGTHLDISQAVHQYERAGGAIDGAFLQDVFSTYVDRGALDAQVLETGGKMSDELNEVVKTLQSAGRNTRAFGSVLKGASGQLADTSDPAMLGALVQGLVTATQHMQQHTEKLEKRLEDTSSEMDTLRRHLTSVREEALTDALTGIANRKRFDEFLRTTIERTHAGTLATLSVILCDIDHFKSFNDTWGHQTGDQIIRFVATTMANAVRDTDYLVARYGGEEFVIVAPGASDTEAAAIAERIRETVAGKTLVRKSTNENLGQVTVSLGVAEWVAHEEPWELVERADVALYASKQTGRDRVTKSEPPAKAA